MYRQQTPEIERVLNGYQVGRSLLRSLCIAASILSPQSALRLLSLQLLARREHGPQRIATCAQSAVVLCVVKDGESLVQAFIDHYLALGFNHIFFLDNGSTDRTVEIIKSNPKTTVFSSLKPFRKHFVVFKNFLIKTCGRGHWCVVADIDEFLQFPLGKSLADVLSYLNRHRYDAVCIQMLDMFSKAGIPLSEQQNVWPLESLRSTFRYYNIGDMKQERYVRRFQPDIYPRLKLLYGGIRKIIFGRNCFLTKEAMFFAHPGTRLKSSHMLNYARRADFSAIYLHYKFVEDFYAKALAAVAAENHWRDSAEYKAYLTVLKEAVSNQQTVLSLWRSHTHELQSIDELIEADFLVVSERFRAAAAQSVATPVLASKLKV
ncbi:glycosyltransferase family 2 protein [cf. Phormidesmis sp. LEGE 11477]|uniref:glycosyltransferase family 2 protein n=1 Tax=cf. Phormidesmis sp. LEGE 11477 TaxID=1828680 RepID=UPI001880A4BB|nr:glycosyltransferase family 2 protein [cf. Phormidesmis sp. LEGE 11477]MBE9060907.1 glycosyltransferase family 2 protein [cf. Phormidesmis sp. LEGE 11477]